MGKPIFVKNLLIIFFLFLFLGLFFDDGKQTVIDVVGASAVICLCVAAWFSSKKQREIPLTATILWGATILYSMIRAAFSDDAGYSIYAVVRMIDVYLLYVLFYQYSTKETVNVFMKWFVYYSLLAMGIAVLFTLVPTLSGLLPLMNLLVPTYGHNHIADILLFALPPALEVSAKNRRPIVITAILSGIVFSFSRAAVLIAGLVVAMFGKRSRAYWFVAGAFIGLGIVGAFMTASQMNTLSKRLLFVSRRDKGSVVENSRLAYWKQAVTALGERPLFGSGPGTFRLQSMRLQPAPDSYSWFSHNIVLERLVEDGVVGTVLFGILIVWCLARSSKKHALFYGVLVALAYGLVDYSFNYLVIWFIFWASLGILTGIEGKERPEDHLAQRLLFFASLSILLLFYLVTLSGYLGYKPAQLIREEGAIGVLSAAGGLYHSEAIAMHKRNPDVLFAAKRYREAFYNNPEDVMMFKEYFLHLAKIDNTGELIGVLEFLANKYRVDILVVDEISPNVGRLMAHKDKKQKFIDYFGSPGIMRDGLAKLLYYLGLDVIYTDSQTTKRFWESARDITVELGHYYVELSSLYYAQGNLEEARRMLIDCQKHPHAKEQCVKAPWPPLPPGSLQTEIQAFPKIL